jgi:hypothetical protein
MPDYPFCMRCDARPVREPGGLCPFCRIELAAANGWTLSPADLAQIECDIQALKDLAQQSSPQTR